MESEFRAREPRYRPNNDIALSVSLQREETAETHDAQLIDISSNGVRLRTAACLQFEETIAVHILTPETDFEFGMVGQVRWIRPASDGHWNAGCHIQPPLSEETLNQLAILHCIDRRCKTRSLVRHPAAVTAELQESKTAATINNVSDSGFGFSTSEPCAVHQKITVEVESATGETIGIAAWVVWEVKAGDTYTYGCSFLSPSCYDELRGLIELESTTSESDDTTAVAKVRQESFWVALAALIVFVIPCFMVVSIDAGHSPTVLTTSNQVKHLAESVDAAGSDGAAGEMLTQIDVAEALESLDRHQAFDSGKLQDEEDEASAPPPGEQWHLPVDYRDWIDNTGRYRVVARLEGVEGDVARLRKENGRQASVPLARLSQEDVLYVRRVLRNFDPQ